MSKRQNKRFNFIKFFVVVAIVVILAFGCYDAISRLILRNSQNIADDAKALIEADAKIPKSVSASIVAIGDTLCHSQNFKDAYDNETGIYDFSPMFKYISKY